MPLCQWSFLVLTQEAMPLFYCPRGLPAAEAAGRGCDLNLLDKLLVTYNQLLPLLTPARPRSGK